MYKEPEHKHHKNITNVKMELMVNIEGICNNLKGTTRINRYSFALDIRKVPLSVFLTEAKLLIRDREFKKSDIIIFYDDTMFRTGTRGFAITRDEIITNINGFFKVFRFQEMDQKVEFLKGHKKDAFRVHIDDITYDIKVHKTPKYRDSVHDVMNLLFEYGQILKEELKQYYSRKQKKLY